MSLLWADFPSGQPGLYGTDTSNMLDGLYAEVRQAGTRTHLVDDPDPLITGNVVRFDTGSAVGQSGLIRRVLPASVTTLGVALRVWLPGLPTTGGTRPELICMRNTGNSELFSLVVDTDGRISAYRGPSTGSGTLLGTSTSPAIVSGAWQHVELKVFLSDTVGTVDVKVEGIVALSLSGIDTLNGTGPCTQYSIGMPNASDTSPVYSWYIKDHLVWDTAGSINNDFFGSVAIYALLTDGDVSLNWTPSTGATGWDLLNESPPDDADYISAPDPAPAAAVMSLTNLPPDVTTVKGLIAIARSMKTDGGDGNLQVSMVSNAAVGSGTDRPITTAFTYWSDVFELDPDTSAQWTPAAVDAADIQFDRTV